MMRTIAIIQARIGSTRLPGKVLLKINQKPMLLYCVERTRCAESLTEVVVATSTLSENDPIAELCELHNIPCFRGDENDVLDRFYKCAQYYKADYVVRLTADCPLIDPNIIDMMVHLRINHHERYVKNTWFPNAYPSGFDVEVFDFDVLEDHWKLETNIHHREHVLSSLSDNYTKTFKQWTRNPTDYTFDTELVHLSVDTPNDFILIQQILTHFNDKEFSFMDIISFLNSNPSLAILNQDPIRVRKTKAIKKLVYNNMHTGIINQLNMNTRDKLDGKNILITGGTGSLGNKLVETILANFSPKRLIIFSRDEYKQSVMQRKFNPQQYKCMRYFIGDVRDKDRLDYAFKNVDVIFHTAALKQVSALEYNPDEAINTNIYGTQNVIKIAIKNNVKYVMGISTDKACAPVNLYGGTKMVMEKLLQSANCLSGANGTVFSVARYGNVFGSRGSVIPLFINQRDSGMLTVTDERMGRFTITLDGAVNFVLNALNYMVGGEIFVPKLPRYDILQLAQIIGKDCEVKIIGTRPGEKLQENMIGYGESQKIFDCGSFYVLTPTIQDRINVDYDATYALFNPIMLGAETTYSSDQADLIDNAELEKLVTEYIANC